MTDLSTAPEGVSAVTAKLSTYVAQALNKPLPEAVAEKTRLHILDTLAAMVSGSELKVGKLALAFAKAQGGKPEATLVGSDIRVPAIVAALANGMMAHADETDDSHLRGRFHPGCGIVPAALAAAQASNATGRDLVRAVALGYDIGARAVMSLGLPGPDKSRSSTHSIGALFGATAAAAALYGLDAKGVRHAFSYACQQVSGIPFWQRDKEHVEKAFDFGGMGARNGVTAALMVTSGFTAVDDPFSGKHNFFTAFGEEPNPELLVSELGTRFEILEATIKKWCVGSPIQSILDATTALIRDHGLRPDMIERVEVTTPDDRIHIIDNRTMPAVCAQHLVALALVDGTVTFASTHDEARMHDPDILDLRQRIRLIPSAELTAARPARQAIVEVQLRDGQQVRHHARAVRGTPDNPMTIDEVVAKALDLLSPIIGETRAHGLVETVSSIDQLPTDSLHRFLTVST